MNKNSLLNDLSPVHIKEMDYEYKVKDHIIKLAMVKPPVTYTEKRKVTLIKNLLKEYGII